MYVKLGSKGLNGFFVYHFSEKSWPEASRWDVQYLPGIISLKCPIYIYIYYCHKQTHVIKMKPFQNVWNRPSSLRCYSQCRLCVMWPEEGRSSCWTIAVLIRFLTLWWRISTQCLCQSLLSRAALLRTTHPLEKVKRLYLNNRLNHLLNLLIMHF